MMETRTTTTNATPLAILSDQSGAEMGEWTIPLKNVTMETQMEGTAAITCVNFKFAETI